MRQTCWLVVAALGLTSCDYDFLDLKRTAEQPKDGTIMFITHYTGGEDRSLFVGARGGDVHVTGDERSNNLCMPANDGSLTFLVDKDATTVTVRLYDDDAEAACPEGGYLMEVTRVVSGEGGGSSASTGSGGSGGDSTSTASTTASSGGAPGTGGAPGAGGSGGAP